jgi:hypothetical protein
MFYLKHGDLIAIFRVESSDKILTIYFSLNNRVFFRLMMLFRDSSFHRPMVSTLSIYRGSFPAKTKEIVKFLTESRLQSAFPQHPIQWVQEGSFPGVKRRNVNLTIYRLLVLRSIIIGDIPLIILTMPLRSTA